MRRTCLVFITLFPSLLSAQPVTPQTLDALARDALKEWRVPGLAIAVVHQDRLVYLRGHGVKEVGKAGAVGPDTIFPIASCTKPLTSLAVGLMVDAGKMAWDEPVRKHVPFFRLADPLADRVLTIRDLLAHRSGVGSHDMLWYQAPWTLEERIRKVAKLEPQSAFRSRFHYQAILFGTAGYAAGQADGRSWPDLVRTRILGPLGMKSSSPVFPAAATDLAAPHKKDAAGHVALMPRYPLDQPDPAGSAHATARDLAQFLRFQLGDGTWQGQRLVAADVLAETQRPQMLIPQDSYVKLMNPATVQVSCGLGWIFQDYRGQRLVQHGGAIDGFRAHLTLVPEQKLGIVLLSNLDRSFMNLALSNTLVDRYLGAPPKDWNAYYIDIQAKEADAEKERARKLRADSKPGTRPSLPLQAYAGKYHDAAYGTCTVSVEKGRLLWTWANWRAVLEHFQDDTFLANQEGLVDAPAEFEVAGGVVRGVKMLGRVFRAEAEKK